MELLRKSDFAGTANALSAFRKRWPSSGYTDSVLFWLGNAQYGKRDYVEAIASFRAFAGSYPGDLRAPEALLAVANCHFELKDVKSARKALDEGRINIPHALKIAPLPKPAQAGALDACFSEHCLAFCLPDALHIDTRDERFAAFARHRLARDAARNAPALSGPPFVGCV